MNTTLVRQDLAAKFEEKDYRDAFVMEQIFSRLPLKIRSMRENRDLTQKELGELADMAQTWVSKLEDPNYGKLTISTLLKLASAFDVGLQVDFVPFSRILDDSLRRSGNSFVVPAFQHDPGFSDNQQVISGTGNVSPSSGLAMGTLIAFPSYRTDVAFGSVPAPPQSASAAVQQRLAI